MRPIIDLAIPVEKDSEQLDKTIKSIEQYTTNYNLSIIKEPDLNVSEARQMFMDSCNNPYICFLDYDSEMLHNNWLDNMYQTMQEHEDAGAVFGGEWWGTEPKTQIVPVEGDMTINYGPAACMLINKHKVGHVKWDSNIGLRSGWLGGDFEEVDYCYRIKQAGYNLYRSTKTLFHHTGGKTTHNAFAATDRAKTVCVMDMLLFYKYHRAPEDEDWFKGLKYVPASSADDCIIAAGKSLRECYHEVIKRNGLGYVVPFQQLGLT